jgi:hypothetical protein
MNTWRSYNEGPWKKKVVEQIKNIERKEREEKKVKWAT